MATTKKLKKVVRKKAVRKRVEPLPTFLQVLAQLYPCDSMVPGLSIAWLPPDKVPANVVAQNVAFTQGCFYASVVRYDGPAPHSASYHRSPNGKQVLYKTYGSTLHDAVILLINKWLQATSAVRQLRSGGKA